MLIENTRHVDLCRELGRATHGGTMWFLKLLLVVDDQGPQVLYRRRQVGGLRERRSEGRGKG